MVSTKNVFLTSSPGLTWWKHLILDSFSDSFRLKLKVPYVGDPYGKSNLQVPTVEVACFVVSQMTPCISEALLSFRWILQLNIYSISLALESAIMLSVVDIWIKQQIWFIPCQYNWAILITDSGCLFVSENRFSSQSSKVIWSELVFFDKSEIKWSRLTPKFIVAVNFIILKINSEPVWGIWSDRIHELLLVLVLSKMNLKSEAF